ncbi:MAG: ATP-binding cassette domain-containing protein [Bacteroidales bacterium]|nr:ATP-binding cassette domain-containing protein [Bacteroidales bacterium]
MDTILEINNVSKSYGEKKALENVSLKVEKGDVFGLLGPNGSGKTTLIRLINQIITPDEGQILFESTPLNSGHIKDIGYLPEERGLYKKMKVGQEALYLAELKGLKGSQARKALDYWFKKFNINDWYNKKVQELSKGMQQKVQFITTVMHNPKLLIFDEPFSGFDPLNADLLKNEILFLRDNGATIIFSTHNMESVEQICDKIVLINASKNILHGKVKDIKQQFKKGEFEIAANRSFRSEWLTEQVELLDCKTTDDVSIMKLRIPKGKNADLLSNILRYTDIISYKEILPSMHEIFVQTITENNNE